MEAAQADPTERRKEERFISAPMHKCIGDFSFCYPLDRRSLVCMLQARRNKEGDMRLHTYKTCPFCKTDVEKVAVEWTEREI